MRSQFWVIGAQYDEIAFTQRVDGTSELHGALCQLPGGRLGLARARRAEPAQGADPLHDRLRLRTGAGRHRRRGMTG